jgi:hypothetical protein
LIESGEVETISTPATTTTTTSTTTVTTNRNKSSNNKRTEVTNSLHSNNNNNHQDHDHQPNVTFVDPTSHYSMINTSDEDHSLPSKSWIEKISYVYQKVMIPSISVILTFTATIGVFPALVVLAQSTEYCQTTTNRFANDLFTPFMFLIFNLFDLIGRASGQHITLYLTPSNIWIAAVLRFLFVPLLLLSNIANSRLPVIFKNDAFTIVFMIGMSVSNGFVATRCMIMGAMAVPPTESGLAGTIMIFSLTVGLLCGACASFLIVFISQGSV